MWGNNFFLVVFKLLPFICTVIYSISLLQWEREISFPRPGHHSLICSFYLTALLVQQPIEYSPKSHFKIFLRLWAFLLPISRIHLLGFAAGLCQLRQVTLDWRAVPSLVVNSALLHKQAAIISGTLQQRRQELAAVKAVELIEKSFVW